MSGTIMTLENGKMPFAIPETQGVSSKSILNFIDQAAAEGLHLHGFQIVRHGKLIADAVGKPYGKDSYHRIFSAAKGIVATAVLKAIEEGYFTIDEPVLPRIPKEWLPEDLDPTFEKLTLYHLLTMTSGHEQDTMFNMMGSDCWIKEFFKVPLVHEPGTFFCYDMGAQYVMNELVALAVGKDLGAYVTEKIMEPMGIRMTWKYTEPEHHFWSSSIQLQMEDLTKLSLLYLQEGFWEGKQLISADLIRFAMLSHVPNGPAVTCGDTEERPDSTAGYALHMWRNAAGGIRFAGGQGQIGMIIPEYDCVFSTWGAEDHADRFVELFDRLVLRKMYARPLPPDEESRRALSKRLEDFDLGPAGALPESPKAAEVSGICFSFTENAEGQEKAVFEFEKDASVIKTVSKKGEHTYRVGYTGSWEKNKGFIFTAKADGDVVDLDAIFGYDPADTLFSGGWTDENTFTFYVRSDAMLCDYRYVCSFTDEALTVHGSSSCHRQPQKHMGELSTKPEYDLFAKKQ